MTQEQDTSVSKTESSVKKPKKANIFGSGSSGGMNSNKVIADKVTKNIMRASSIEEGFDDSLRGSTTTDGTLRATGSSSVIDRGTEKLRALGRDDDAGQNLISNQL